MPDRDDVLVWWHGGSLHITPKAEQNIVPLKRIVALATGLPAGSVDFAVRPSDKAADDPPRPVRLDAALLAWAASGVPPADIARTRFGPDRTGRKC